MEFDSAVKFYNYAFDERDGDIRLRGAINTESLQRLRVDAYQREVLPRRGSLAHWTEQFRRGFVPDIDLGMRGGNFAEESGSVYLLDEVYIVDGLQRRSAALEIVRLGGNPQLGATVRFNTTETWERERFRDLNMLPRKVAPDLLLRNQAPDNAALRMLIDLGQDNAFPLYRRICWGQRMRRDDLIHGLILLKAAAMLHCWLATGMTGSSHSSLTTGFDRLMMRVGRSVLRSNVHKFFALVDDCWGLTNASSKTMAISLKSTFLLSLARLLAEHENFWRDTEFHVSLEMQRKLASLNIYHPYIVNMCSAGGRSRQLYADIVEHLNRGAKTNRLVKRADVEYETSAAYGSSLRVVESSPAMTAKAGGQ